MNKKDFESSFATKLPDSPGVYLFKHAKDLLYVGKATSLKQRVRSYFSSDLIKTRGRLLVDMVTIADRVEFQSTDSVLEALILEAQLIKEKQPKYNTKDKDNKSYNYVVITDEDFPRVLVVRGRLLEQNKSELYKEVFGPYPYGGELKEALKLIRKIFPFRDKCVPYIAADAKGSNVGGANTVTTNINPRPCFNRMIGLCPGVCTGEISKKDYGVQIKNIKMFFEGKKPALLKSLEKQMAGYAKTKEFEKAGEIKRTIFALNHIQDVSLIKDVAREEGLGAGGQDYISRLRIEAYDIAHLSGKDMVGVMVVMENGELDKGQYRKFIINNFEKANDPGALEEVVNRRIKHEEWERPDIVVLDGNKIQLKRAYDTWNNNVDRGNNLKVTKNSNILFCSVVKDSHHKSKDILFANKEDWKKFENFKKQISEQIIRINAESHRFAIAFHKNRRKKNFL
jgi:excinuclease UvrABC nuclease subunit